jgi:hypothetical protein
MKPAIVVNKAVVSVSDCPLHPKYQALKPPTSSKDGCVCQTIYDMSHPRQEIIRISLERP